MKAASIFVAVLLLSCSQDQYWKDATRQNRASDQMRADRDVCLNGSPLANELDPPDAEVQAIIEKLKRCMAERGWNLQIRGYYT